MSARARLLTISGAFILAVAAYALLAAGPAAAATPRVLAIRFGPDLEHLKDRDEATRRAPARSRSSAPRAVAGVPVGAARAALGADVAAAEVDRGKAVRDEQDDHGVGEQCRRAHVMPPI